MPCYSVQTISVKFNAKHRDVLDAALKDAGVKVISDVKGILTLDDGIVLDLEQGVAEVRPYQQAALNRLKQAYTAAALKKVCGQKRWATSWQGQRKGVVLKA